MNKSIMCMVKEAGCIPIKYLLSLPLILFISVISIIYIFIFFFSSCLLFLSKIEGDLDRTIIDRMNEYGSVDDVKKSFDRLQQRVRFSP